MILFKSKEQRIYSQTQNKYFNYKRSSKDIFTNAEKIINLQTDIKGNIYNTHKKNVSINAE